MQGLVPLSELALVRDLCQGLCRDKLSQILLRYLWQGLCQDQLSQILPLWNALQCDKRMNYAGVGADD